LLIKYDAKEDFPTEESPMKLVGKKTAKTIKKDPTKKLF
jgi:hypothetical protein